jgi:hypothetical protein
MKHPTTRDERRAVNRKHSGDDYAKGWRWLVNRMLRRDWGWVQDRARRDFLKRRVR